MFLAALMVAGSVSVSGCRDEASALDWVRARLRLKPQPAASEPVVSAEVAKANAERLLEMFRVVFEREPKNEREFVDYVDTLNQGASLEGIYNGFSHSAYYRQLEEDPSTRARAEAVAVFARELEAIQSRLVAPTHYRSIDARPLRRAVDPARPAPAVPEPESSTADGQKAEGQKKAQSEADFLRIFAESSAFTLKRVLADEALRLLAQWIDSGKSSELLSWYGDWCVEQAGKGVDFGLPDRNRPDAAFHREWASRASHDTLRWEVLNRLHRRIEAAQHPSRRTPS